MRLGWKIAAVVVGVLVASTVAACFVLTWPDAYHDNAQKVVREAGVHATVLTPASRP